MVYFPNDLGCWIWDGFGNTAMQPKRYLGKRSFEDRRSIITGTFLMESELATKQLLAWWVNDAKFGYEFVVSDPHFFGSTGTIEVRMVNDLSIVETGDDSFSAIFTLEIMQAGGLSAFV